MDKTAEMTLFVQSVEAGGFSAAARQLDLTPSAVSRKIGQLEDRLQIRLFDRTTRRIHLTEAGKAYYQRCLQILRDIEEAEDAISSLSGDPRGTLRIAATVSFGRVEILPRINEFMRSHPHIKVEVELTDRHVNLIDEGFDVAIQWREQMNEPNIVARKLCVNRRIICAAPEYLEEHGTPTRPEQILEHNCLTLSTLGKFNAWEFDDETAGLRTLHVDGNFRVNTADGLYEAALSGVGLARLSTWLVAKDIQAGRLVAVLPDYPHDFSAFYILYPHRRYLARKVRAFVDFLVDKFSPEPPWELGIPTRLPPATKP